MHAPYAELTLADPIPNSSMFVLAKSTAPAARSHPFIRNARRAHSLGVDSVQSSELKLTSVNVFVRKATRALNDKWKQTSEGFFFVCVRAFVCELEVDARGPHPRRINAR